MRRIIATALAAAMVLTLAPIAPEEASAATLKVGLVATNTAKNTRSYVGGASLNGFYDSRMDAVETLLDSEGFDVSRVDDAALGSLTALKAYDVLVLPRTLAMTQKQRDAFLAYVTEGGGAVASFGMSRWDYNSSYKYDYMPFLGTTANPGLYSWPPSTDHLKPWEWGEVSELYNVKFKNDPLMYENYQLAPKTASSHWILNQSKTEAGSLTMTASKADYNEVVYALSGASNVTPLYTYNTKANANSADNTEHGYMAGWATEYYFGRFVYFGFQLHDMTRGGIYADDNSEEIAERIFVNSVKWAGSKNTYTHVAKRVTLTGKAWYSKGVMYIDETVKNTGAVSTRGPLKIEVRNPYGSLVYSGQAYNNLAPLPPGASYTHRSYQVPVSPTAGTWTVTMTYKYHDHFYNDEVTAKRVMYVSSTGSTMATKSFGDQISIGGHLPVVGDRIAGATRFDTSVEISEKGWPTGLTATEPAVILATGSNYPDALAAAPLAGKYDAPVLLVPKAELTTNLRTELKRLFSGHTAGTIFVVGGEGAVAPAVVNDAVKTLSNAGVAATVERVAGANRWATASAIAEKVGAPASSTFAETAIIVSGQNYPDALAIGALAADHEIPILLVSKDSVPTSVQNSLSKLGIKHAIIVGGTSVVGTTVEGWLESKGHRVAGVADNTANVDTRLAGSTRYGTSLEAVDFMVDLGGFADDAIYMATGTNWPDALALASLAGKNAYPLVLMNGANMGSSSVIADYLIGMGSADPGISFIGGEGAISDFVRGQAGLALKQ